MLWETKLFYIYIDYFGSLLKIFWLWWNSCQSMIVNNSSFFQGWCSHSWKERVDTTQRGFQVFIFFTFVFSSFRRFLSYLCVFCPKNELIWFSTFSNFVETSFVALPRPPTNLRVESAQHNMIKVRLKYGQVWSSYVSNILQDNCSSNSRQVKWDSPSQDSLAIDRSR